MFNSIYIYYFIINFNFITHPIVDKKKYYYYLPE